MTFTLCALNRRSFRQRIQLSPQETPRIIHLYNWGLINLILSVIFALRDEPLYFPMLNLTRFAVDFCTRRLTLELYWGSLSCKDCVAHCLISCAKKGRREHSNPHKGVSYSLQAGNILLQLLYLCILMPPQAKFWSKPCASEKRPQRYFQLESQNLKMSD